MATATAGSLDLTNVAADVFDDSCDVFWVRNRDDSAGRALIHVDGLHDAGEYAPLMPGVELTFRRLVPAGPSPSGAARITAVSAKAEAIGGGAATATIDFAVLSRPTW